MSTKTVHGPVPVIEFKLAAAQFGIGPTATATWPAPAAAVGTVQPAGTITATCDPALKSFPVSDVKVNVNVLPVLPALVVAGEGETDIFPSPFNAFPAAT